MAKPYSSLHRQTPPVSSAQLRELIAGIDTRIKFKELKDNTPFQDAGADSLDVFNLVLAIEETYGITISSDQLSQVNTLDKLALYLNERLT